MIPLELKVDKNGLLYTNDDSLVRNKPLLVDNRNIDINSRYFINGFYRFKSTLEYIIKYSYTDLSKKNRLRYMEMLAKLIEKQKSINNTDFPIGYFIKNKRFAGLIIKYYKDGVSLESISDTKDINLIGKYYYHDEDNIHNLFLLLHEFLDNLNELFDNNVYYLDINSGNIIIDNNKVRLIDFDPTYVKFDDKDKRLALVMQFYIKLINELLINFQLYNEVNETLHNFEDAKKFTKKIENCVRK